MGAHGEFLQRKPLPEARALLLGAVVTLEAEEISVDDAHGRVAAESVVARHPAPHYRASAMDGIAVRSADTLAAAEGPIVLRARGGDDAACCTPVDTGSLLPEWADAVVRIEDATMVDGGYRIRSVVPRGRDVRREGEDIEAGTTLVPAGQRIRPADVGAMLATGTKRVLVRRRPDVAILATGGEVVEPAAGALPGQVIEYNSRVIAGMVEEWGAIPHRLGIVADDEAALAAAVLDAATRFDVVCVVAGSSAGRKDFTIAALSAIGEVFVHGVDIAPGRPVALARLRAGDGPSAKTTPAIAVPGYPVATIVACEQFLRPLVAAMLGTREARPATMHARLARKIPSRLGVEEFRRVCLTRRADGSHVVAALPSGAGSISTVTGAHAWLRIASTVEGLDAGAEVEVELMVARDEIDAALVLAGSHSNATAAIERLLRVNDPRARVFCLGLGHHDALAAVERGEAHAAVVEEVPPSSGSQTLEFLDPPRTLVVGGPEIAARLAALA